MGPRYGTPLIIQSTDESTNLPNRYNLPGDFYYTLYTYATIDLNHINRVKVGKHAEMKRVRSQFYQ